MRARKTTLSLQVIYRSDTFAPFFYTLVLPRAIFFSSFSSNINIFVSTVQAIGITSSVCFSEHVVGNSFKYQLFLMPHADRARLHRANMARAMSSAEKKYDVVGTRDVRLFRASIDLPILIMHESSLSRRNCKVHLHKMLPAFQGHLFEFDATDQRTTLGMHMFECEAKGVGQ